jgi:hypothetical protein
MHQIGRSKQIVKQVFSDNGFERALPSPVIKDNVRGAPMDEAKGVIKDNVRGAPMDEPKGAPMDEAKGAPMDEAKGVIKDNVRGAPMDEAKGANKPAEESFIVNGIMDEAKGFVADAVMEDIDSPVIKEIVEYESPLGEPDDFQPVSKDSGLPSEPPSKLPEEFLDDIPIITYDYDGDSYFLDNRTHLQRTFDFPDGSYPLHLCVYTCVRNGCCPYLLYLTVYDKSKGTLIFPTAEPVLAGPEDSDDDIRERTMESFKTALFDIFPPTDDDNRKGEAEADGEDESTDVYNPHLFQGLFLDENDVFMVYDATRVVVPLGKDKEYFWVTPYEITALYKYRNVNIDPYVIDFFHSVAKASGFIDKSFYHLKRVSDGAVVPSPYVLFPCSHGSSGIFSLFSSSAGYANPVQLGEEEVNLLIPTIDHPSIGNAPLFSTRPLDPSLPNIQRYAVFVDIDGLEPFFIDEKTPEVIDHLYDLYQTRQYSSVNFIEKDVEYWCVKSPLYMTEIRDRQLQIIPINTFQEIDESELPKAAPFPKDSETLSNEGSDVASDEGDERSDEGSDIDGSNEGSMRASDEESEKEDEDDFHRGYQEGLLAGMKRKGVAAMS